MIKEPKLYQINRGFAKHNKVLIYFVAKELVETAKAVYLYGHGTTEVARMGVCMKCGRTLTHPVSVELGIGPECGQHFHNWDLIGGYSLENIERLKGSLVEIKIDQWFPKSQIIQVLPSTENISVPEDHYIFKRKTQEKKKKIVTAVIQGTDIIAKIEFGFNHELLDKVRSLPGRKYHKDEQCWSCPIFADSLELLVKWGFELDDKLKSLIQKEADKEEKIIIDGIPGLNATLYPFQEKGVSFIEANNGKVMIADEMGLGKTIQALAWLQLHPEKRPVIVVVPASLKLNWKKEAEQFMSNPKVEVLSGSFSWETTGEILIINYDILFHWTEYFLKLNPMVLITDECHYYKNPSAKRTKAVMKMGMKIPHIIALSGTPIVNRPIEAFNALKLIAPTLFPNYWQYAKRYCNMRHNGFGWDMTGASHTEELHEKLKGSIMIRRLKVDVLPELPDKIRSFVPMELDNRKDYKEAEANFIAFIRRTKGNKEAVKASNAEVLSSIEGLKQLAVRGKLEQAVHWVQNFIQIEDKLVVFAVHKFVIGHLMDIFGDIAVKIDGSVSTKKRQKAVERFQNDSNIKLFVGNIKAAGVGITLTAASNVVFLELPWTPGDLIQAEDRCHRIGQKDTVNIHYLLASNTIEEKIAHLIDNKRKILDAVLDGKITEDVSLLSELMKEYNYEKE